MTKSTESLSPFAPDPAQRLVWTEHLEPLALAAGQTLFRQGDPADSLYFVESGELGIWLDLPGQDRVQLRTLGPGQCLGEMALYRRELRGASVEAATDAQLWRLTASELARLERTAPALALAMHRHVVGLLAGRLAHSNTHIKDPLARLAHAIRDFGESRFLLRADQDPRITAAAERKDEVGEIASAIRHLERQLHSHIEELRRATTAREQIASELRIAGRIQGSFLPAPLPAADAARIDFAALCRPAREAGGDLYDGFFLDPNRFFFAVGDVSGKGVPAALFMAVTAMCLRALATAEQPFESLLERVNNLLCQRNSTQQFVSLLAGVLDTATGELAWTNCGHPAPLLLAADGADTWLEEGRGPPAGVFENVEYATQRRSLRRDDLLVLYTDGVTEALDPTAGLYGEARLRDLLVARRPAGARACVELVAADVAEFAAGAPQADDLTLAVLRAPRAPA